MAIKANLLIDQGTDFSTDIDVLDDANEPVNLAGYSGAAQMRKHYTSSTSTAFTVAINASGGTVTLSMNATTSANVAPGRYVYDCELTSSSNVVSRLVEGIVTVTPQVTR
jgi:hypothetical protein